MSDRLTIRLPAGAEAPGLAVIDEVAGRHGMTASQWVRSLITRELKALGDSPARAPNEQLRSYAAARTDDAVFDRQMAFEQDHPSARDAHLRPRAPKRPSVMRVRVSVSADEAVALEEAGLPYEMSIQQVATIIVRRWLGLNKKPPAGILGALSGIRAEIRRIGVNVNQLAHAANKLLADPRLRRQDVVVDQLSELEALRKAVDVAMKSMSDVMGLDRTFWAGPNAKLADRFEMLPHPAIAAEYADDDPP